MFWMAWLHLINMVPDEIIWSFHGWKKYSKINDMIRNDFVYYELIVSPSDFSRSSQSNSEDHCVVSIKPSFLSSFTLFLVGLHTMLILDCKCYESANRLKAWKAFVPPDPVCSSLKALWQCIVISVIMLSLILIVGYFE